MTNKEIFIKAHLKAGFSEQDAIYIFEMAQTKAYSMHGVNGYILSHEFAMVFWGVVPAHLNLDEYAESTYTGEPNWQYHLQRMVLEPEPLKYLEKFL